VRNIVTELQGEKIDIVRYNEDIREYIKGALSPAQIAEIKMNKEKLKAEVIVDDDQLSLAIGKHGQNVRLASRLVGWDLDIRTKLMIAQEALQPKVQVPEVKVAEQPVEKQAQEGISLEELSGVGEKILAGLREAGYSTVEAIAQAGIENLVAIKGIGKVKAEKLLTQAKKLSGK
jgi:N utilization substance protein A